VSAMAVQQKNSWMDGGHGCMEKCWSDLERLVRRYEIARAL
jgi:hypothetical protein